jgi:hypothetical protein
MLGVWTLAGVVAGKGITGNVYAASTSGAEVRRNCESIQILHLIDLKNSKIGTIFGGGAIESFWRISSLPANSSGVLW